MVSQGHYCGRGAHLGRGRLRACSALLCLARTAGDQSFYDPLDERELAMALKAFAIGGWLVCLLVGFWALGLGKLRR